MLLQQDLELDPFTFEILRHRLFALNDEIALAVKNVSGSPACNVGNDFNTGLLSPVGDVLVIGIYMTKHALSLQNVAKFVLAEYSENPGINEGDMFICNDPYVGALHQSDVIVVSPIHWKGELLAWSGAVLHETDVGGTVVGSQCNIGAKSIFDEAPPMPPVKIVHRGVTRKDIKAQYLRRSRFPDLLELDLTAKISANNVARARMHQLVEEYGVEVIRAAIRQIEGFTEARFRSRLRELPDGTWRHRSYMEYEGRIYICNLAMTKLEDHMTFDFTGSSPQAPAVINCPYPTLIASVLMPVLAYLCWDFPWSPSGIIRAIDVVAEPGTVVYPVWPAGVSKGSTAVSRYASVCAFACLGRMMLGSERHRDHAMACWAGSIATQELFGTDWRGRSYGGVLVDSMCGGAGARTYKDGIDMGGSVSALSACKVDVESYEYSYPLLYLYCRQQCDSGGAGRYRGGTGMSALYVPHGVDEIPTNIMLSLAADHPESPGIGGGYPGATDHFAIRRASNIGSLLRAGVLPEVLDEVEGKLEMVPGGYISSLGRDQVWVRQCAGGGGFGDPLDRDAALVASDVAGGLVSPEQASAVYGVILSQDSRLADAARTAASRQELRALRRERSLAPEQAIDQIPGSLLAVASFSDALAVVQASDGARYWRCRCGWLIAPLAENYKGYSRREETPVQEINPMVNPYVRNEDFVFRRYYCPACLTLFDTEIALRGEPPIWDVQPRVGPQ